MRRGSIRQLPSGRWRAEVRIGRNADGSARRPSCTCDTREQAEIAVARLIAEEGGSIAGESGVTLRDYWMHFVATKGERLTRVTIEGYERSMRKAWLVALGDFDIASIERHHIQAVLLALPSRSIARERKKALSAVLTQAVLDGVLEVNPCRGAIFELPGDVGAADDSGVDYDSDPFGAIEQARDIWNFEQAVEAAERVRGTTLETIYLAMIGAGLRREEALALRWRDVRRIDVDGVALVQVAVHHAKTPRDGRKRTKGTRSVRIAPMLEPFGARLWELRRDADEDVCRVSEKNVQRRWRKMWEPVSDSRHVPLASADSFLRGRMLEPWPLPFMYLRKARSAHETILQERGLEDSLNAALHGHTQRVAYGHYLRPDSSQVLQVLAG